MKQLSFAFAGGPRAVIQIMPQPIKSGWGAIFKDDWVWNYGRHCSVCTNHPETSDGMLKSSPYQVGKTYEDHIIVSVRVVDTRAYGWCWLLELREPDLDDLEWFWEDAQPAPARPTECEHCGCVGDPDEEGDNYLYDVPPIEGDFDDPVTEPRRAWVLCWDCKEEHVSYWNRMLTSASA